MDLINDMDADLILIENSRSDQKMVKSLVEHKYDKDVGAGIWDIHSPVVPKTESIVSNLSEQVDLKLLNKDLTRIWVVPDCGLKTRKWEEVIPSVENMVKASEILREKYVK